MKLDGGDKLESKFSFDHCIIFSVHLDSHDSCNLSPLREDILDEEVKHGLPPFLPQGNSGKNMKQNKSLHLTRKSKSFEITSTSTSPMTEENLRPQPTKVAASKELSCESSHSCSISPKVPSKRRRKRRKSYDLLMSPSESRFNHSSDDVFEFCSRSPSPLVITKKNEKILPTRIDNLVTPPSDSTTNRPKVTSRYSIMKQNKKEEESTVSLVNLYKRRCRSCTLCNKPNCGQCYTCITNKNATLKESLVCLRKVR